MPTRSHYGAAQPADSRRAERAVNTVRSAPSTTVRSAPSAVVRSAPSTVVQGECHCLDGEQGGDVGGHGLTAGQHRLDTTEGRLRAGGLGKLSQRPVEVGVDELDSGAQLEDEDVPVVGSE